MKPKKKGKKLQITEADYMLANRRAARLEGIAEHGRPVSFRSALHKSKKVYDRKRLRKAGIGDDGLLFFFYNPSCDRKWVKMSGLQARGKRRP